MRRVNLKGENMITLKKITKDDKNTRFIIIDNIGQTSLGVVTTESFDFLVAAIEAREIAERMIGE